MPIDASIASGRSWTTIGCSSAARIRSIVAERRRRRSGGSGSSSPNSSPPSRATVSDARSAPCSRAPTSLEQLVAGRVAERVVDLLEAIEVHHQRPRAACRRRSAWRDRLLDPVAEEHPVRQAGERVVQRLVLVQLGLAR